MTDTLDFYEFDSLGDLVSYCEESPLKSGWEGNLEDYGWINQSGGNGQNDFYGSPSPEAAIELARYGWAQGRDKMIQNLKALENSNEYSRMMTLGRDIAGAYPCVPSFCAGKPDSMITRKTSISGKKRTLTIWINRAATGSLEKQDIENYGAGALSLIDALEASGLSTELYALNVNEGGNENNYCLKTRVKAAGESLDIDSACFSLVHASYQRRFKFKHLASVRDYNYWADQGRPINLESSQIPEDVLYLPSISHIAKKHYATPKAAALFLTEVINKWAMERFNAPLIEAA